MTKEDLLKLFKEYTTDLMAVSDKGKVIEAALRVVNSCDALWIVDEHSKWLKEKHPEVVKRAEEIMKSMGQPK